MILLDSNVVSALMRLPKEPLVQTWLAKQDRAQLYTSAPAMFEIRFGIECQPVGRKRNALETASRHVLSTILGGRVLPFDDEAAYLAATARATLKYKGINPEIPDSQIAGIAMARGAAIATRNVRDYDGLGIEIIDPWQ